MRGRRRPRHIVAVARLSHAGRSGLYARIVISRRPSEIICFLRCHLCVAIVDGQQAASISYTALRSRYRISKMKRAFPRACRSRATACDDVVFSVVRLRRHRYVGLRHQVTEHALDVFQPDTWTCR